jgi:hypothetical protein
LKKAIPYIRWVLVAPAAISGFFAALIFCLLLRIVLEKLLAVDYSSPDPVSPLAQFPFYLGGALAPVLVVAFGTLTAPRHRFIVAWVIYAAGALFTVSLDLKTWPGIAMTLVALATGGYTAYRLGLKASAS